MTSFTTEQEVPFSFTVKDGRGRPVQVDGTPEVASSDETVVKVDELTQEGNKWTGKVTAVAAGSARVVVQADADLGEGSQTITGVLECEVTQDERTSARTIELEAGSPVDKAIE